MDIFSTLPIYELFLAGFIPIAKVFLVAAIGATLGATGVIDKKISKGTSAIVLKYLLPSLMASRIGRSMTWEKFTRLWILPLASFVHTGVGFIAGSIACIIVYLWKRVEGDEKSTYNFTVAVPYLILGTAFGNCGYLPLSMLDAIVLSFPWFNGDDSLADYGEVLVSIYLIVFSPSFWLFAYQFVKIFFLRYNRTHMKYDSPIDGHGSKEGSGDELDEIINYQPTDTSRDSSENSQVEVVINSLDEEEKKDVSIGNQNRTFDPVFSQLVSVYRFFVSVYRNKYLNIAIDISKHVISPPFVGVVIGLSVGLIPPLNLVFYSSSSPLVFVMSGLSMLGDASMPMSLIVLGFSQYYYFPFRRKHSENKSVERASQVVILLFVFLRLFIVSSINSIIMLFFVEYDILPDDNMLRLVLLLEGIVPPAVGLQIVAENTTCEREVSLMMFWSYVFSIVMMSLWLGFFAYVIFIR